MLFVGGGKNNFTSQGTISQEAYTQLEKAFLQHSGELVFPSLQREEGGKPYFVPLPKAEGYQHFNLSHSRQYYGFAFHHRPLGVDIQVPKKGSQALYQRVCSQEERLWLEKEPEGFSLLWTMKEAYLKYHGWGIGRNLKDLPIPLPEENKIQQKQRKDSLDFLLYRHPLYDICVCGEELGESLTIVSVSPLQSE